jgi:hypothetical protein
MRPIKPRKNNVSYSRKYLEVYCSYRAFAKKKCHVFLNCLFIVSML